MKYTKTDRIVVSALIIERGKILAVKRSDKTKHFPTMMSFPGGKVEKGEDLRSAIVREVLEETGYVVKPVGNEIYLGSEIRKGETAGFYVIRCKVISKGKVVVDEMVDKGLWVGANDFLENLTRHNFYKGQIAETERLLKKEGLI